MWQRRQLWQLGRALLPSGSSTVPIDVKARPTYMTFRDIDFASLTTIYMSISNLSNIETMNPKAKRRIQIQKPWI